LVIRRNKSLLLNSRSVLSSIKCSAVNPLIPIPPLMIAIGFAYFLVNGLVPSGDV
jgi:hypothetical protein